MKLRSKTKHVHFNDDIQIFKYVLNKYHNYIKDRHKTKEINKYLRKIERKLKKKKILTDNEFFDCKIIRTH